MDVIKFLVKGSAPEPYHVTFTKTKNNLNAFCTCPAGENGQYCKHRFDILSGSTNAIVSKNQDEVAIIRTWLPGSDVEEALKEMTQAEHESNLASKRLSLAKKKVAKAMRS
jgi:uncharacterized Zn finger protein